MPRSRDRRLVRLLAAASACVTLALAACRAPVARPTSTPTRQAQLAAAIADADRIEVAPIKANEPGSPALTLRGPEVVADFLKSLPLTEPAGDFRCPCDGMQMIRFFAGDRLLVELSVHHYRSIRWRNGPWQTDAFLAGPPSAAFCGWILRHDRTGRALQPSLPEPAGPRPTIAPPAFVSFFPETAQSLLVGGYTTVEGFEPRKIQSALPAFVPDKIARATAVFRALGSRPGKWLSDDVLVGTAQTAIIDFSAEELLAAFAANRHDDLALHGAARIYFRFHLHRRLDAEANAEWLPRLADAALRLGETRNKSVVLVYVAASEEPAGHAFLREIASGARDYAWEFPCWYSGDVPLEPSLVASAAVLLALGGDTDAARLARRAQRPVPGLDDAAVALAQALLTPPAPLPPAVFKYPSHVLGYAAAEALNRQSGHEISLAEVRAGLDHQDHWVAGKVRRLAERHGLTRYTETGPVELHMAPVAQNLAAEDPPRAIQECTDHLATAQGRIRTALLVLRGTAYERQRNFSAALADFEAALQGGHYSPVVLHRKIAWLVWGQGRLIDTTRHAELALREQPDADMLVLRGITKYAVNNFGPDADRDFTAALALNPNHGYAQIFQHLCAHLSGRPELSRLPDKARFEATPPTLLQLNIGTMSASLFDGSMPVWPATIINYLKGELTADQLLEAAKRGNIIEQLVQAAEAHFYIAQQARIDGNGELETEHLRRCVAVELPQVAEYGLAKIRLADRR